MKRISTKTAAEAALRELPSVLGAYVSEDGDGNPREIHLLVRHGPDAGRFARDIHSLLEERLGIPIDQRVISIAQLDAPVDVDPSGSTSVGAAVAEAVENAAPSPGSSKGPAWTTGPEEEGRPVFAGIESSAGSGQVQLRVRLAWRGETAEGEAEAVDTQAGRARAAAAATLRAAADASWSEGLGLELDFASVLPALDGEYVLVAAMASSDRIGRRTLPLVGAHRVDGDVETAAALAALKAVNRILGQALRGG